MITQTDTDQSNGIELSEDGAVIGFFGRYYVRRNPDGAIDYGTSLDGPYIEATRLSWSNGPDGPCANIVPLDYSDLLRECFDEDEANGRCCSTAQVILHPFAAGALMHQGILLFTQQHPECVSGDDGSISLANADVGSWCGVMVVIRDDHLDRHYVATADADGNIL